MDIKDEPTIKKKYIATLIGTGIGDTLGMPIEGWKKAQVEKYNKKITAPTVQEYAYDEQQNIVREDEHGKIKYYGITLKKGQYTDDTILTIALAKAIVELGGPSLENIADEQLLAYRHVQLNNGKTDKGFGQSTITALEGYEHTRNPYTSAVNLGPGNGPAMKIAPLGLYMDASGEYDTGIKFAKLIAKITHQDPRSIVSAVIQANNIYTLLHNVDRKAFVKSAYQICKEHEEPLDERFPGWKEGDMRSRLKWIKENMDATVDEAYIQLKNSSKVYESVPFAIFMMQKYWDNPIEGLITAVNYGGDSDTIGAMYGAMIGAKHGMIFPKEWVDILDNHEEIKKLGEGLYNL